MDVIPLSGRVLTDDEVLAYKAWQFKDKLFRDIDDITPTKIIEPNLLDKIHRLTRHYQNKRDETFRMYDRHEIDTEQYCERIWGEIDPLKRKIDEMVKTHNAYSALAFGDD
ncbi:MAG: hypothetical protein Q8Q42_04305 [Nanoarchaeota archaeon]|nr:hypothetical protein [Nanoarchaeota archaeon]